jgi:PHP family Zn ribbon phosphoesterase
MSPSAIFQIGLEKGINLMAVTDHNSYWNSITFGKIALRGNFPFFYGMEVQTEEEAHFLVYFDDLPRFKLFGEEVYNRLPEIDNDPEHFGDQVAVDEEDNVVFIERKLLLHSIRASVEDLFELGGSLGGLVIPAHVDADHFSILGQLGFIPRQIPFPALEVTPSFFRKDHSAMEFTGFPLVCFSDAHYLKEIGRSLTVFKMEEPTLEEFALALKGERGRGIIRIERGED